MKYEKFVQSSYQGTIGGELCRPVEVGEWKQPPIEDIIKEYESIADEKDLPIEYCGAADVKFTALPKSYFTLNLNELVTMDIS